MFKSGKSFLTPLSDKSVDFCDSNSGEDKNDREYTISDQNLDAKERLTQRLTQRLKSETFTQDD